MACLRGLPGRRLLLILSHPFKVRPREERTFVPLGGKTRDAVGSFRKAFNFTRQNCGRFHNKHAAFVKNGFRATPGTSSWHIGCAGSLEEFGRCNDCQIPGVTHQFHGLEAF
jgi:hypothetical protein